MKSSIQWFFLICSERSGSNFITKLFDSHPDVCGPSPSHLIRVFSLNLWRYGDLNNSKNWQVLTKDVSDYMANQIGKWQSHFNGNELASLIDRSLPGLVKHIYLTEAMSHGKNKIFIKENHTYRFTHFLLSSFPNAKFIYMVRDPRDMALSLKLSNLTKGGVYEAANLWKKDQEESIKFYSMLTETQKACFIKYESLLINPEIELRKLCDFLKIKYSKSMLQYHSKPLTNVNANRMSGWSNLNQPVIRDNFNKYKKMLSETEIKYVESVCREEMSYLNYIFDFPLVKDKKRLELELLEYEKEGAEISVKTSPEELQIRTRRLKIINQILKRKM